jgi:hypothetical protein
MGAHRAGRVVTLPPAPRYGTASVADLLPEVLATFAGDGPRWLPLPTGTRGVEVLVIDGLGRANLDRHRHLAPTLAAAPGPTIDAPFPSTTAVSLTSIGTGLAPGEHGLTGYSVAVTTSPPRSPARVRPDRVNSGRRTVVARTPRARARSKAVACGCNRSGGTSSRASGPSSWCSHRQVSVTSARSSPGTATE